MLLEIYSIYDEKSSAYLQPFFMQNESQAVRAMLDIMHDMNHSFYRFASDYTLFKLGTFDNHNGSIISDIKTITPLLHLRASINADKNSSLLDDAIKEELDRTNKLVAIKKGAKK